MKFRIITLMDNRAREGLESEHGFSVYVESGGTKLLFDTGQSDKFMENAKRLGVNLDELDYVVVSHGHYDHSGGLKPLLESAESKFKLLVGEGFFEGKYKLTQSGDYSYIGNSFGKSDVEDLGLDVRIVDENMLEIAEDMLLFRGFDNMQRYESLNENFVLKEGDEYRIDDFSDELVLGLRSKEGLYLLLGCSHPGLINILETVRKRTGEKIAGVIGGTHLVSADKSWVDEALNYIEKSSISLLATSHCTGDVAEREISKRFPERYLENFAGKVIDIC